MACYNKDVIIFQLLWYLFYVKVFSEIPRHSLVFYSIFKSSSFTLPVRLNTLTLFLLFVTCGYPEKQKSKNSAVCKFSKHNSILCAEGHSEGLYATSDNVHVQGL